MLLKNNIPSHVGFIPHGRRRWAGGHGLPKEAGYAYDINPGLLLFDLCKEYGIQEVSIYGFTQDNNKRPIIQKQAFTNACVTFALEIARSGAALLVVGDETSTQFPRELKEFRHRQGTGIKLNLLVNCGWEWDLAGLKNGGLRSDQVSPGFSATRFVGSGSPLLLPRDQKTTKCGMNAEHKSPKDCLTL